MKMLKNTAIAAAAIVVLLVATGVFLPATARVVRQIDIEAPAATVFALVNTFDRIEQWAPWTAADPNARYQVSGPRRGVGATLVWDGPVVGSGSQVITGSEPFTSVVSSLDLGGPGVAIATIELVATDFGTRVTWSFENDFGMNIAGRFLGLFLHGAVGEDYEAGLRNLKQFAETLPAADFADVEIEHRTVESANLAILPTGSIPESTAISEALGEAYFELLNFIDRHGLQEAGAPMSIGGHFDGAELRFNAAIPIRGIRDDTPATDGPISITRSYAGPVIRVKHVGPYRSLSNTHDKIAAYLAALGIRRNGDAWESYVSDPTRIAEEELLTYVYYPVAEDR